METFFYKQIEGKNFKMKNEILSGIHISSLISSLIVIIFSCPV